MHNILERSPYLKYAKNIFSQNGEDGILVYLIEKLEITKGSICEFGSWDGIYLSNCYNVWKTKNLFYTMIEADQDRHLESVNFFRNKNYDNYEIINKFVEDEGENSLDYILKNISTRDYQENFQILSIDIDSADYSILEKLNDHKPSILIIECNPYLTFEEIINNIEGSSYQSISKLCIQKGYTPVVYTLNCIAIRNDLIHKLDIIPDSINLDLTIEEVVDYLQHIDESGNICENIRYLSSTYKELIAKEKA